MSRYIIATLCLSIFAMPGAFGVETTTSQKAVRLEPVGGRVYPPVVTAIAIHPSGKMMAVAGDDHAVRLLSGEGFVDQRVIGQHHDWVRSLDFSSDGQTLLSAGNDGLIQVWREGDDWNRTRTIDGGPALASVRFSANGQSVAAVGFDSAVYLMQSGDAPKLNLNCDCRDLRSAVFTQSDKVLAVGGRSGELHLFELASGALQGTIALHAGRLRDCVLVGDSGMLASVGEDSRCAIADLKQKSKLRETVVPGCKLLAISSLDAQRVAVGGSDNLIHVIDVQSGEITHRLVGHEGSVAVLRSHGSMMVSGSYDTTIRFWNLDNIVRRETVATIRTGDASIAEPSDRTDR